MIDGSKWFALQTRSRAERLVESVLEGKGYEPFLPVYQRSRQWSDRQKKLDAPLFPGYLFCRLDPEQRMPVLTTPGVLSIVGSGKTPEPIPDSEIASIQAVLRSGKAAEPWPYLKAGERIRVAQGAMTGLEGLLVKKKNQCRLVVSVELLQRSVAVEIDAVAIRPI
jgi:transcription antitermination factor NusG